MIVLSHLTALEAYRRERPLRTALTHIQAGDLAPGMESPEAPSASRAEVIAQEIGLSLPLHVLVPDDSSRKHTKKVHCHAWSGNIPEGALVYLDDGLYLSAPEFLFQQLCSRSDFENRFMLGSELVGGYAISPDGRGGLLQRPPLCTRNSILDFLNSSPGLQGYDRAMRVARYLLEGARSPKEAEIAALYSLPRSLGGRGIRQIDMNVRFELSDGARRIARRAYLLFDHFLRIEGRDHEYDSDDFHLTRERHESDARRENALKLMGIKLTVMTNGQLHDWDAFDAIASSLAIGNDAAFRSTSAAIEERQKNLWERLLFGRRVAGKTLLDGKRPERSFDSLAW